MKPSLALVTTRHTIITDNTHSVTGNKHSLALAVAHCTVVTDSTHNVTAKTHILAPIADCRHERTLTERHTEYNTTSVVTDST